MAAPRRVGHRGKEMRRLVRTTLLHSILPTYGTATVCFASSHLRCPICTRSWLSTGQRRLYPRGMLTVEQAIRALRREILTALAEDATLPRGATFSAERVTISLAVRMDPATVAAGGPGALQIAEDPGPSDHRVTVEFRLGEIPLAVPATSVSSAPAPSADLPITAAPDGSMAFAGLARVFGAPGFDSSARATVFRETLEELDAAQQRQALLGLGDPSSAGEDPAVVRARHLIRRLAASGPAGSTHGPRLLRELATRCPVEDLVALAASRWRTQSEWAAEAAGRP